MEKDLTTQQIIGGLIKVGHKDLDLYTEDGLIVVKRDPHLFAHLIAWNNNHSEIRAGKAAYPVIALRGEAGENKVYYENAVAHLLLLDPKTLVKKALPYHHKLGRVSGGASTLLKEAIIERERLRMGNRSWWNATALQHRQSIKSLYAMYHIRPSMYVQNILFGQPTGKIIIKKKSGKPGPEIGARLYPEGSVFEALKNLKSMSSKEAAGMILKYKIPFLIAVGAVGGIKNNVDLGLALIERMTGAEVITNSNILKDIGVLEIPELKSAYEDALERAKKDKRVSSFKADRAASAITDERIKSKLEKVSETRITDLKGLEGDWLILGDRSGSMDESIVKAIEFSAILSRSVKGKIYLVFFNTRPQLFDVSDKSLDEVRKMTSGIRADGGTSIGCGLELILEKNIIVNGIAIFSDGGENQYPFFPNVYEKYESKMMISPTVYLLHVPGDKDALSDSMKRINVPFEKIDVKDMDYYGFPNLLKLLRTSRYTLIDEIMNTNLLTITEAERR